MLNLQGSIRNITEYLESFEVPLEHMQGFVKSFVAFPSAVAKATASKQNGKGHGNSKTAQCHAGNLSMSAAMVQCAWKYAPFSTQKSLKKRSFFVKLAMLSNVS